MANSYIENSKHAILVSLSLLCLIGLVMLAYWNGLYGPFLFDDFANINALGKVGGVHNLETFKLFVFGNKSGPTGRPIAMLSFLLNDNAWPSSPFSFKYTNLLLHLLNGMMLLWIISLLIPSSTDSSTKYWLAIFTAAIWLLHPLNVSTVLYPVQRMAILATTFVLAGILVHIIGRKLTETSEYKGYLLQTSGLAIFTALAALSKENGALLPILILVLELTILPRRNNKTYSIWVAVFLIIPTIILLAYLLKGVTPSILFAESLRRPFTMWERLLTQSRVLLDYLYYWFIPHINSPGLLTQDFPLSKSLTNPVMTLPAVLIIISLPITAMIYKRRFPVMSLAVLFYFTGHLVESTVIQLELYFEHRNYLPGVFLSLPIAVAVGNKIKSKPAAVALTILIISILSLLTWQRATIWSDEQILADQWARIHPYSQRAQRHAALTAERHGNPLKALSLLQEAKHRMPGNVTLHLHWMTINCRYSTVSDDLQNETLKLLENGFYSFRNSQMLTSVLEFIATPECKGIDSQFALQAIEALSRNKVAKQEAGARHQLAHNKGLIYLSLQEYDKALLAFQNALKIQPRIETGFYQISLLATHQQYDKSLQHVDDVKQMITTPPKNTLGGIDYTNEIKILEETIRQDMID